MGVQCPRCGFGLGANTPPEQCLYCSSGVGRSGQATDGKATNNLDKPPSDLTLTLDGLRRIPEADIETIPPAIDASKIYIKESLRYELDDMLGEGGMGRVIKARDHNLQRSVALKLLHANFRHNEELVERFVEEARVTGQLQHPNIVSLHELNFDQQGSPFYTMKQVRGHTLRDILNHLKEGDAETVAHYPLRRLLGIFLKICDAMAYAHSRGVLHRDLKPENVMTGDFGEVVVMDWGLAKVLGEEKSKPISVTNLTVIDSTKAMATQHGRIIGTPQYMSPEQAAGRTTSVDHRSDIYTLGVILYEILTLQAAFDGENPDEVITQILAGRTPQFSNFGDTAGSEPSALGPLPHLPNRKLPESMIAIVNKAISLDRELRYQSVLELQADIEAYLAGFATQAEQAGVLRQTTLFMQRNKLLTASAALIGLLLAGSSVINFRARQDAVAALEKSKSEQALRELRERQSAPAFVDSAIALANAGGFEGAETTVNQALTFYPELTAGLELKIFLQLIRDDLAGATETLSSYLEKVPNDYDLVKILDALYKEPTIPPRSTFSLATLLAERGYPQIGARLRDRNKARQADLPKWLAIYKNSLQQSDADGSLHEDLSIDEDYGLSYRHIPRTHQHTMTDISVLQALPMLKNIELDEMGDLDLDPLANHKLRRLVAWHQTNVRSLEPLRSMRLESLIARGEFSDLSPLSGMPLKELILDGEFKDLSPLRGLFLHHLHLEGPFIDLAPLKDMRFTSLALHADEGYQSLNFLREHPELTHLSLHQFPFDGDYTPLYDHDSLIHFQEHYDHDNPWTTCGRIAGDIYKRAIDDILKGKLESARKRISEIRIQITPDPLQYLSETGEILDYLVRLAQDPTAPPPSDSRFITSTDDKTFVWLACRRVTSNHVLLARKLGLKVACIHSAEENNAIASMLGRLRVNKDYKVDALIGAFRATQLAQDPWQWEDGSPWDFTSWKPDNADKRARAYIRDNGKWEVHGRKLTEAEAKSKEPPVIDDELILNLSDWPSTVVFEFPKTAEAPSN